MEFEKMFNKRNKSNELQVVKSDKFGEITCDVYGNNDDEYFMTIDQLTQALGYSDTSGIRQIISRNEYLRDSEFSTRDNLSQVEGDRQVSRERILFTEDGIYEITMLSQTEKGRVFRRWIRSVIKSICKTGKYESPNFLNELHLSMGKIRALGWRAAPSVRKQHVNENLAKLKDYYHGMIDQDVASEPNPMSIFVQDYCIINQYSQIDRSYLYDGYVRWCIKNNVYPKSKTKLAEYLDEMDEVAYLRVDRKNGLNARFMGIELNDAGLKHFNNM